MLAVKPRVIFTFATTTQSLAAESLCRGAGLSGRLIPVPGKISAGCGMCWAAPPELRETLTAFFAQNGVEPQGVYEMEV